MKVKEKLTYRQHPDSWCPPQLLNLGESLTVAEKQHSVHYEATVVGCALKEGGEIVTTLSGASRGLSRERERERERERGRGGEMTRIWMYTNNDQTN